MCFLDFLTKALTDFVYWSRQCLNFAIPNSRLRKHERFLRAGTLFPPRSRSRWLRPTRKTLFGRPYLLGQAPITVRWDQYQQCSDRKAKQGQNCPGVMLHKPAKPFTDAAVQGSTKSCQCAIGPQSADVHGMQCPVRCGDARCPVAVQQHHNRQGRGGTGWNAVLCSPRHGKKLRLQTGVS